MADDRAFLEGLFFKAIRAVDGYSSTSANIDKILAAYPGCSKLFVIGFGKASCQMAKAIEDHMAWTMTEGVAITKYGHASTIPGALSRIKPFEAGHPIPDENGLRASELALEIASRADENTLTLCLISGGGSALLVCPYPGVSLADKRAITDALLMAGADIFELNAVRKHISRVKGGRLAELALPSKVISLIISDVMGDRLDVIASGPTAPDNSTYQEAFGVLEKYGLLKTAPRSVLETIGKGMRGEIRETPKEGDAVFDRVENIIIASNGKALYEIKKGAMSTMGAEVVSTGLSGEARDAGRRLAEMARGVKKSGNRGGPASLPLCLISGGETTVTVRGKGKGGRNTELALAFAIEIEGEEGITLLSAGTDGTDGPTDAAGAFADGGTVKRAESLGMNPMEYLNNNDSYNFFKKAGGLFTTGPTGTNVMDVQITVIR